MARLYTPLEDAAVVVVDEVEARPGRLVAARQGDLPPVEGVEPQVVRGRVWHARGDHDAVAVVERDEATVEGADRIKSSLRTRCQSSIVAELVF